MQETKYKVQYIDVSLLKIHPENPRTIKDEDFLKLCESIKSNQAYFEARPCIVDTKMIIWAGNQRYKAGIHVGMESVPTVILDLPEAQMREIMIRDNVANGEWDKTILAQGFTQDELEDWGIDMEKFGAFGDKPEDAKDDDVPEVPPSDTKIGDLFILGDHRVLCGDATKPEHFNKLMNGKKATMVFTDPPYNVDYGSHSPIWGKHKPIANDNMSAEDFLNFLSKSFLNIKNNCIGSIYVALSCKEIHTFHKAFSDAGLHWSTYIIWVKNRFTPGMSDHQRQHEPIMYGFSSVDNNLNTDDNSDWIFYGWEEGNRHKWYGGRKQGDVWHFDRPTKSDLHPTMKPVMLCAKAITNSSKQGQIVLDSFLGSGSTLIASEKTGRVCYGMELDPHYTDIIVKRWEEYTGKRAEKVI